MIEILQGILGGVANGAIVSLLGYAKSSKVETFDPRKATQTVIVGAVIGGFAGYYGWTYQQAYEWASSMGIITIIEYVKKAILRRMKK